jgi:hydroxymethylbilane synthase
VQCRADDETTLTLLRRIHHQPTWAAVTAERAFLSGLGGGCAAPVAAYATGDDTGLQLRGMVASLDGRQVLHVSGNGSLQEPERLGRWLAQEAMAQGATKIMEVAP